MWLTRLPLIVNLITSLQILKLVRGFGKSHLTETSFWVNCLLAKFPPNERYNPWIFVRSCAIYSCFVTEGDQQVAQTDTVAPCELSKFHRKFELRRREFSVSCVSTRVDVCYICCGTPHDRSTRHSCAISKQWAAVNRVNIPRDRSLLIYEKRNCYEKVTFAHSSRIPFWN